MIIDEKAYLEHSGVKGMRWRNRTGKQKALLVGAGVFGFNAASYALRRKHISFLTSLGIGAASAATAVAVTNALIDNYGQQKVSAVKR